MNRNYIKLILIFSFLSILNINAQELSVGISSGLNISINTIKSDYQLAEDYKLIPVLSGNIGGYLKTTKSKLGFIMSLEYQRLHNKDNNDFIPTNENGDPRQIIDNSVINHMLIFNTIGTFKLAKELYVGVGLSGNILLKSVLRTSDDLYINDQNIGNRFKNYQYKLFTVSIPVTIGYSFKNIDLFLRFDKGIMNKINSSESFIKEVDNVILLGCGYRFSINNKENKSTTD
jgi:hypothetical protein